MSDYRKSFSSQLALMYLIEKSEMTLDKNGYGGTIQINPSKPFDTINHDRSIAKSHFYLFLLLLVKINKKLFNEQMAKNKALHRF